MEHNENYIQVNMSIPDFRNIAGWATFNAIINIIVGALSCLGIITAAYGVPQIIAGVRLLNAADDLKRYLATNDYQRITEAFFNLNKYFKLNGIATIVKICMGIVFLIIYIGLIVAFISNMPDMMYDLPGRTF